MRNPVFGPLIIILALLGCANFNQKAHFGKLFDPEASNLGADPLIYQTFLEVMTLFHGAADERG